VKNDLHNLIQFHGGFGAWVFGKVERVLLGESFGDKSAAEVVNAREVLGAELGS
jgi:hypothetical protein